MLTNTDIARIKPKSLLFRVRVDSCLLLEVSPKGGKRRRIRYGFSGKDNLLSLGSFPGVGIDEAKILKYVHMQGEEDLTKQIKQKLSTALPNTRLIEELN